MGGESQREISSWGIVDSIVRQKGNREFRFTDFRMELMMHQQAKVPLRTGDSQAVTRAGTGLAN
jgi:hypothetical protein